MQKLNAQKIGQTWSVCSRLSPECLCRFDEGVSTEVELPFASYSFHGRGFGQGGEQLGRVITNIVDKEMVQEERELFSPSQNGLSYLRPPTRSHKNFEQSIELPSPLASFNNNSVEIQQCELEQTKIILRQKADMQRKLNSKLKTTY